MTHREMLHKMHLSEEEFRDLMKKFSHFYHSLDERQRKVMKRSLISCEQAAKTFGPDVTVGDLQSLAGTDSVAGVCGCTAANGNGNGDS